MPYRMLFQLFAVLSVMLTIICCASTDWRRANELNTTQAYQEFLNKHPKSEYTAQARNQIELLSYAKAKEDNSVESMERFIQSYPRGKYSDDARVQLENLSFKAAQEKNTIQAYEQFQKKYPSSNWTKDAKIGIDHLKDEEQYKKFLSKPSIETGSIYLRAFPQGQHYQDVLNWMQTSQKAYLVPDTRLFIEIVESIIVESLTVHTGEFVLGGSGLNSTYKTISPSAGHIFIRVKARIYNIGSERALAQEDVFLHSQPQNRRVPIEWHQDLGGMLSLVGFGGANSIKVREQATINMTFDVPADWRSKELSLYVLEKKVGEVRISLDGEILTASSRGDAAALRRLLESGGNANARSENNGETALMIAAGNGHAGAVRLLLSHGADVQAQAFKTVSIKQELGKTILTTKMDWTALDAASANGHSSIVDILKKAGAK